ncbi:MAG: AbrB/MazE/SpoVT family DNA-binding domain-containing protein [Acidimicrobiales bacterium]
MASAGITRTIDGLGRVVLPVEFRRSLAIGDHDLVEISLESDRIVITRVERTCVFCGAAGELREHRNRQVCASCIRSLAAMPLPPRRSGFG